MSTLELLAGLGLPSAFVGMVLIALIFKRGHPKISTWAACFAVALVGIYGVIQLAEALRGSDVGVRVEPQDARAFSPSGRPVDLEISVVRRSKILTKREIEKQSEAAYQSRPLTVDARKGGLAVEYQDYQLGLLNDERLRALGWRPAEELRGPADGRATYWYTNRVHVGQVHRLGETSYGTLKICARRFTSAGEAVVTLVLEGHGEPIPKEVGIRNKGLGVQSFQEIPEFYIAVREADFQTRHPWAAFSVFSLQ